MLHKLYVRIWLAVVLAVAVLTLLVGWAWRMASDPPLREVVVRNASGEVIGSGKARLHAAHTVSEPSDTADVSGRFGEGPEFEVLMQDGQLVHLHLPRKARGWRAPFGFFWILGLVAVAVAIGTYPVVRRLTRRLEALQHGVEQWGEGNLAVRVSLSGQDEVGFLAERFNHAAAQVEALVHARDRLLAAQKSLLANASHELRSPLTRIRMGLELLGEQGASAPRAEIARNIGELDQLIDEILLASRLDAQQVDLGTVEAVDLVGMAAEECSHTAVTLELGFASAELLVPGVAKLLRRALRNLLENADRHAGRDATLSLSMEADLAVVRVCDRGPGVPAALRERIFEPFYRLPGASERDGGAGLGLALVLSIAKRHGGAAICTEREGGGACFEIRLPRCVEIETG